MVSKSFLNFSYVAASNIIGAIFQGAFYLIFATFLEPQDYGIMTFIIALAGTVSVFSRFGLPTTLQIYKAKNN